MNFTSPQAFLDTRTLNVAGTTTFASATAGSTLFVQNGAVINNPAGATWTIVNGSSTFGNGIILNGGTDRKSDVEGKRVDLGGRRIIKKKKEKKQRHGKTQKDNQN